MNIKEMEEAASNAAALMRVLSNERRLMILCQLIEGEKSVSQLTELLEMRQTSVSQQLAQLRAEGLVTTRREAQTIYYALSSKEAERVIALLYEMFCRD